MRNFFQRYFGGYRPEHYSMFSGSFEHHGQVWF